MILHNCRIELLQVLDAYHAIRVAESPDGEVLFATSSIAQALGMTRTSQLLRLLRDDQLISATYPAMPGRGNFEFLAKLISGRTLREVAVRLRRGPKSAARHVLHWLYVNYPEPNDPQFDYGFQLAEKLEALVETPLTFSAPPDAIELLVCNSGELLPTNDDRVWLPFKLDGSTLVYALPDRLIGNPYAPGVKASAESNSERSDGPNP